MEISAKKKKAPSRSVSIKQINEQLQRLGQSSLQANEQVTRELSLIRQDLAELKSQVKVTQSRSSRRSFRPRLFSRSRFHPPQPEPNLAKINLEELLPLLPHLGGVLPQLNNPKVAEAMKMLANPAVIGIIQQFLQNGGLKKLASIPQKGRSLL